MCVCVCNEYLVYRNDGLLLQQLYMAFNSHSRPQRRISSQLVALLTHENPRNSLVMRKIFPSKLLDDCNRKELIYNENGIVIDAGSK